MRTPSEEHQLVTLVKTDAAIGHLKVGTKQETKHPIDQPRDEAIRVAYRRLKRSAPDESPSCWSVSE